ncbi:MAG: addiction module protein, partial [Betaproteobacteria bacterium]|nr:addiction module protein [Betaproteobacteria bacterium]
VEDIWDSIAQETPGPLTLSAEEDVELIRRLAAHEAEPSNSIAWGDVRNRLFQTKG